MDIDCNYKVLIDSIKNIIYYEIKLTVIPMKVGSDAIRIKVLLKLERLVHCGLTANIVTNYSINLNILISKSIAFLL